MIFVKFKATVKGNLPPKIKEQSKKPVMLQFTEHMTVRKNVQDFSITPELISEIRFGLMHLILASYKAFEDVKATIEILKAEVVEQ